MFWPSGGFFGKIARGARPSRSPGGASRAALPDKDVSGGTPNTACGTHALPWIPTQFDLYGRTPMKYMQNIYYE